MFFMRAAGVVAMGACVAMAMGAAVKFKSMEAVGVGLTANPEVDGMATYRYNADTTFSSIQVIAQDLQPQTTYSVLLESDVVNMSLLNVMTTNSAGNGQCHIQSLNTGDLTDFNPKITIFIWDGEVDQDNFPIHIDQPDITDFGLIRAVATNN